MKMGGSNKFGEVRKERKEIKRGRRGKEEEEKRKIVTMLASAPPSA